MLSQLNDQPSGYALSGKDNGCSVDADIFDNVNTPRISMDHYHSHSNRSKPRSVQLSWRKVVYAI